MTKTFTAYMECDSETGLYVGNIPSVPGAHTQAASLDELQSNLREVLELCLEEMESHGDAMAEDTFVGIQKIAVNL